MQEFNLIVCHSGDRELFLRTLASVPKNVPPERIVVVTPDWMTLKSIARPGIKFVKDAGVGYYSALNLGFASIYDPDSFAMVVNSGDELSTEFDYYKIAAFLEATSAQWLIAKTKIFDETFGFVRDTDSSIKSIESMLWGKSGFLHQSVIVQNKLFQKLGGFNTELKICADLDFFIRARQHSEPIELNDSISVFYLGGVSSKSIWRLPHELHKIRLGYYQSSNLTLMGFFSILFLCFQTIRKIAKNTLQSVFPRIVYKLRLFKN